MSERFGTPVEMLPSERQLMRSREKMKYQEIGITEINPQISYMFCITDHTDMGFDPVFNRSDPRMAKSYELTFFLDNGGSAVINQTKYDIKKNDIRIHKPGDIVYSYAYSSAYVLHFILLQSSGHRIFVSELFNGLPSFMTASKPDSMTKCFQSIWALKGIRTNQAFLKKKKYLWDIMNHLVENAHPSFSNSAITCEYLAPVLAYIKANYSKRLTLAEMSRIVHIHPNYLHKVFKKNLGITPFQYLQNLRMDQSCELLIATHSSIADIAAACGFEFPSYYISLFKRTYGMTPLEFRRQNWGIW